MNGEKKSLISDREVLGHGSIVCDFLHCFVIFWASFPAFLICGVGGVEKESGWIHLKGRGKSHMKPEVTSLLIKLWIIEKDRHLCVLVPIRKMASLMRKVVIFPLFLLGAEVGAISYTPGLKLGRQLPRPVKAPLPGLWRASLKLPF